MIWEGKIWCEGFLVSSSFRKKVWCRLASDLLRLFIRTFRGATRHAEECLTNMFMFCILVYPQHELLFVLLLVQLFSRWWFQIFFIFTPTWGRFPFWLIFLEGVETTNQYFVHVLPGDFMCVLPSSTRLRILQQSGMLLHQDPSGQ